MRVIYIISLLTIAAASFFGGYTLGQKNAPQPKPLMAEVVEAPSEAAVPAAIEFKIEEAPEQNDSEQKAAFEARSQQTFVTFTDTKGRSLEAEVIEAQETTLKIRRKADRVVMMLPIDLLSAEDKTFAVYLWEQQVEWEAAQKQESADPTESEIDKLFEQLFK